MELPPSKTGIGSRRLAKGMKRHIMWELGMIELLQPEVSHATDAKPQVEAGECWGDVVGVPLGPVKVRKASQEELKEFAKHGVYVQVPESECWAKAGTLPIGICWIDINKGDELMPEYRSRLDANDIKLTKERTYSRQRRRLMQ